jgi:hypothetical protein
LDPNVSEVLPGEEVLVTAGQDDELGHLLLKADEKYGDKQGKNNK